MATLRELTGEFKQLLDLAHEDDIDPQVISDTMWAVEGEFDQKIEGYAFVRRELAGEMDAIQAEIDRLEERLNHLKNCDKRLADGMMYGLTETGKTKVKTPLITVWRQKSAPSVHFAEGFDPASLDERFLTHPAPIVSKKAIKDALDAGEEVEGCWLEQNEFLRMK